MKKIHTASWNSIFWSCSGFGLSTRHFTIVLNYLKISQTRGLEMWLIFSLWLENSMYFVSVQVPIKGIDYHNNTQKYFFKTVDVVWFAHSTVFISICLSLFLLISCCPAVLKMLKYTDTKTWNSVCLEIFFQKGLSLDTTKKCCLYA